MKVCRPEYELNRQPTESMKNNIEIISQITNLIQNKAKKFTSWIDIKHSKISRSTYINIYMPIRNDIPLFGNNVRKVVIRISDHDNNEAICNRTIFDFRTGQESHNKKQLLEVINKLISFNKIITTARIRGWSDNDDFNTYYISCGSL